MFDEVTFVEVSDFNLMKTFFFLFHFCTGTEEIPEDLILVSFSVFPISLKFGVPIYLFTEIIEFEGGGHTNVHFHLAVPINFTFGSLPVCFG